MKEGPATGARGLIQNTRKEDKPLGVPDQPTVVCTAFKSYERNTLKGFADLWLRAARLNIHGCPVHESGGKRWVQLPARAQIDNGELVKDDIGKIQYLPVMEFDSREVGDRFSQAAVRAVEAYAFKEDFSR